MKIVVQVKPLPSPEQAAALAVTLHACSTAANRVSVMAFDGYGLKGRLFELRRAC